MDLLQEFMQGVLRFWRSKVRVLKSGGVKKETFWQKWKNSVSRKIESDKKAEQVDFFGFLLKHLGAPKIKGARFGAKRQEYRESGECFRFGALFGKSGFFEFQSSGKRGPGSSQE